jgi:hypothetical protein
MILRCATEHVARELMKAKRPFGAHVSLAPNSGVRADIPGPPLLGHEETYFPSAAGIAAPHLS